MTRGPLLAAAGAAIAVVASACGIGGGLFGVPLLHYGFGLPLKRAVATTLVLVLATASASTVAEVLHPGGALFWDLAAVLAATALVATQAGYRLARRISTRRLKATFCLVLVAVGVRLIFGASGGAPVEGLAPSGVDFAYAALIGIGAGVVVPLLGVGGGLIVVPALVLLVPDVGYLGARATSLAVATLTAARSVWLYSRDGAIEWERARWFGGGALLGAAGGVWAVHLPRMAAVGQMVLGLVLWTAALRFGLDVARPPASGEPREDQ